jgi:hypothetical protein
MSCFCIYSFAHVVSQIGCGFCGWACGVCPDRVCHWCTLRGRKLTCDYDYRKTGLIFICINELIKK